MTVKVRTKTSYTIDHEGVEIELVARPNEYGDDPIIVKTETGYKVGYMVQDDCAEYPPDDMDGMGKIGTSSRRDRKELNEIYQDALGLTSNWERRVTMDDVVEQLADRLDKKCEQVSDWVVNEDFPYGHWVVKKHYNGRFKKLIKEFQDDGTFGNPDAVTLDVYEHGGRVYHVGYNPNFVDRAFDCAYGGAVWVPDSALLDEAKNLKGKKRKAKMIEWAEQCVETVNQWSSGDVYCIFTQNNDADGAMIDYDRVCGLIGHKYAKEELANMMKEKE